MSTVENPPTPPSNLGERGGLLWESIAHTYELNPTEIQLLIDACREADLIERLQDALSVSDLTTRGSMGQEVASPFVSEIRQHRLGLSALMAKLKLPETPATAARKSAVVSEKARMAARARWGSAS